ATVDERSNGFVGAGRVLDQEQKEPFLVDGDALEAAERRGEALETGRDLVELCPEGAGESGSCDRVVDVVETRQPQLDSPRPLRRVEPERGVLEPVQRDVPRRELETRPRMVAARAPVVAEVADVGGHIVVRRAAADAVLRVRGMLKRGACHAWVVEAEGDAP